MKYNFTSQMHECDTFSIPDTVQTNMHACPAKNMENPW